jgi:hypothetical protein
METNPFFELMRGVKILRPPRHMLATFGSTTLNYVLLSPLVADQKQCRRREGHVIIERPQILTPDLWRRQFEGFGEEAEAYREFLDNLYGEAFRALQYRFKNTLESTSTEHASLAEAADRAAAALEKGNSPRTALLQGPDSAWNLSIMKFIVDISMRSFPSNVRELNERGFFDPAQRALTSQRREIEKLFREAQTDRSAIHRLGEFLKQTGLFSEYEDRFFALINEAR